MKLREHPQQPRRIKTREMLGIGEAEVSLNEQVGLPGELEQYLRQSLEGEKTELVDMVGQLETAVGLITLFPEENEVFKTQAPVNDTLVKLTAFGLTTSREIIVRALVATHQLAPDKLNPPSQRLFEQLATNFNLELSESNKVNLAAQLIRIFPEHTVKIKDLAEEALDVVRDPKNFWNNDGSGLWTMEDALFLDPGLHQKYREFILAKQPRLKAFFESVKRVGKSSEARSIARWYADYKLLLAEEITVTQSGILLAIEKPKLTTKQQLPDRLTA